MPSHREEQKFRMMELGIDDDDEADDRGKNKNDSQRGENPEKNGEAASASNSSSSTFFTAFSEGGNCSANAIYTRFQYIYRQSGASEYPLTTLAILTAVFWLLASGLNSFFFAGASGEEGSNGAMRMRPSDLLPRRFRFGENGVPKTRGTPIRIMPSSDFRHFDELKSYMHPTELAGLGVDTEGHVLKQRPLLELNKNNLLALKTSPPPPLAPGEEEKQVYDVDLPKGFNRWDEVHQNIWRKAKQAHIEELRAEAAIAQHARAETFLASDKDSSDLDKVLQEEAAERARAHLQDVLKDHLGRK